MADLAVRPHLRRIEVATPAARSATPRASPDRRREPRRYRALLSALKAANRTPRQRASRTVIEGESFFILLKTSAPRQLQFESNRESFFTSANLGTRFNY